MTSSAYMLIALIIGGGSCQELRLIVQKMASLELCQAAANLATKGGGLAERVPVASSHAGPSRAVGQRRQAKRSNSPDGSEAEVQQLNRAQLGDWQDRPRLDRPGLTPNQVPTDDACKRR